MRRMNQRTRLIVRVVIVGAVCAAAGAIVRGFFPPFVLDDPFWRDFWSGPPAAGLFAVVAAVIAFFPAYRSTRITRENAAREQWWNRAEWALSQAVSDKQADREVANSALVALSEQATEMEAKMIFRVIENLQGSPAVDNQPNRAENGTRRRWLSWRRS
ncbi:hypothetical protein [Microbacterium sp. NPDC056234]|uniref:hypothetical protein n=1 Tax=Microbacterium sp. NPDC056234 TaxID=3345757 RepID=UPI0035D6F34D